MEENAVNMIGTLILILTVMMVLFLVVINKSITIPQALIISALLCCGTVLIKFESKSQWKR